jgi:Tfp pilus assembly protein PilF
MRLSVLLVRGSALFLIAALAPIQMSRAASIASDFETCRGNSKGNIAACNRVIASPRATRVQIGGAYINRGQHYYEQQDFDRALADFDKAIPLDPQWVQLAYGNRGNVYFRQSEDQKAIDNYSRAIALDPTYASAYTSRGILYEKAGSIEQARADFTAALAASSIFADNKWAHDTAREHLDALAKK